jgi:hypothetical protein
MKKQEKNKQEEIKQEDNKDLVDELYDIDNLKNDLDEILNLEGITVSESLIQATLTKAREAKEENIIPYEEKVAGKRRGIPFRYGMIAACACILIVAGFNLIKNIPLEMGSSKDDGRYEAESSTDSEAGTNDMKSDTTTETTEDSAEDIMVDNTDDKAAMSKQSIFDVVNEDGDSYQVKVGEIEKVIIYDENGAVTYSDTDSTDIQNLYDALADIDSSDYEEVVQNEEHKGQYVKEYAIIADEGLAWSELHLWITSTNQETYIVTMQLKTSDGETITHRITDVSADIIMNVIDAAP